jgi:hypothetical protein
MAEDIVGTVEDFFAHPVVAGIRLTDTLKVGDKIRIKGHTTDLEMEVGSMQIDNAFVPATVCTRLRNKIAKKFFVSRL